MTSADADGGAGQYGLGRLGVSALGVAYVAVGLAFFVSLVTNWIELFTAVLVGIVGLVGLSLAIIVRREGLLTAENKLIAVFVVVAMGLLLGLTAFTDLSSELVFGVVFVVGVLVPHLLVHNTADTGVE